MRHLSPLLCALLLSCGTARVLPERTKLLVIVHPPAADSLLRVICRSYATTFDQESVMMVSAECAVEFVGR